MFLFLKTDINRKIANGAFWSLLGSIISKGLLLLSSVIISRILGAEIYGEVGIIRSTVNMFTAFAGMGIGLTATKYISEFKSTNAVKAYKIIKISNFVTFLTGGVLALVIVIFSQDIANQINAPHLKLEIQLSAFILFFNTLNGVQTGILAGFEDFKSIAINNLSAGIFSFVIQIIFTYLWGLFGAIIGFGSNFFILWALNKISVDNNMEPFNNIENKGSIFSEINVIWKFSLPAVLSGIMVGPVNWICNMFLVNQSDGYTQMALFDAANQWRITILFIPTALSQIILPMLSSSVNNSEKFYAILRKNMILNIVISLVVAFIVIICSPLIVKMYNDEFYNLYSPLVILVSSTILITVNNVIGQYFASKEKMWIGLLLNTFWAITFISISYILIVESNLGAKGLAISFLISYLVHILFQGGYMIMFEKSKLINNLKC